LRQIEQERNRNDRQPPSRLMDPIRYRPELLFFASIGIFHATHENVFFQTAEQLFRFQ